MPRIRLGKPASLGGFNRAALIVALLVLTANVYRRLVLDTADPYRCSALLNTGQWLDSPDRKPEFKPFRSWQPPGCLLYSYTAPEIAACNERGKILFVGDAGVRQVFWAAAKKMEGNTNWVFNEKSKPDTHGDIEYEVEGARLQFLWDPWWNSSTLREELRAFRERRENVFNEKHGAAVTKTSKSVDFRARRSVVILIGGGLWHARHYKADADAIAHFRQALSSVMQSAYGDDAVPDLGKAEISGKDGIGDHIFFAPVIDPIYDRLSPSRETTIAPMKLSGMNRHLQNCSVSPRINVLWSYTNMTRGRPETYGESGLHVIDAVASRMADILLNLRCNAKAARKEGYPYDRTCCSAYKATNWIQLMGFAALLVVPLVGSKAARSLATSLVRDRAGNDDTPHPARVFSNARSRDADPLTMSSTSANTSTLLSAVFVLLGCVCCCFLTDRTQVFDKFSKQFSNLDFRLVLGLVVIGCLYNIKPVPGPKDQRRPNVPTGTNRVSFLPRVQSDEFKGWMQVYVLIYGYTASSNVLDFYEVFRIFLALYLFLSGYGHTMYFLETRDFSLRRVASVLLRRNTLAIVLSLMMDRPYASYYFVPLVSFWFLVVYLTLRPGHASNTSLRYVFGKIIISALLVTCFIHVKGVLELCSTVLHYTTRADLDAHEWRFHLGTDKYIVYVGMIVAILHLRISSILNTPMARLDRHSRTFHAHFCIIRILSIFTALVVIPGFWILTRRSRNKADYASRMPYMAWLPVLSFVILRNATKFLRSYYCASFAWIGRISLELYLLSNHIWLAGDGRGLLRAGWRGDGSLFMDRWRDLVLLTPIFVWAAWRVSGATATITAWVMGAKGDVKSPYDKGERELQSPNHHSGLPGPASSGERRAEREKERQNSSLAHDVRKRLLVISAVVWLGNLFYG